MSVNSVDLASALLGNWWVWQILTMYLRMWVSQHPCSTCQLSFPCVKCDDRGPDWDPVIGAGVSEGVTFAELGG